MPSGSSQWLRRGRAFAAKSVKDLLGRVLVLSGMHHRRFRGRGIIVAFHSITQAPSTGALRCGVDDFEIYCRFFAQHMRVCTLTELAERVREGRELDGSVAITFDDGYADNAELAAPVLNRNALPATFFVTTHFIDSDRQAPWDVSAGIKSRWMTRQQVKALHEEGHEIGAHTRNHCDLGAVPEEEGIAEIEGSAQDIRDWVGAPPKHFAIPYGRAFPSLPRISAIAKEKLGFETVTLCRGGLLNPEIQVHAWERIPVSPVDYLSPYGWLFDVARDVNLSHS
ncbi:polysaccharide deacetylase family protein [Thioalkalivibrio sulfidiphilus]|uniref:polysaccharide deacetylase family protein n=1 Tax=Thioalkalivibrio sulfidiphilus TaxID=1033854 RepID=UPI0018CAEC39|nr:polysaccharide deacetylase family protein [Thioalkalivibrio sulfidiphilus]